MESAFSTTSIKSLKNKNKRTCMEPSHRTSDNYTDPVGRNHVLMCVTACGCTVPLTSATHSRNCHVGLTKVLYSGSALLSEM